MMMRFGAVLGRLLTHRAVDPAQVARTARLPGGELDAVLAGGPAQPALLRALAPALGFHVADLFVMAGLDPPGDLAPAETSPWHVGHVIFRAYRLTPPARRRVHEAILSMPAAAAGEPARFDRARACEPGGLAVRLLINRNIRPWCAKALCVIGGGPYVSDSTVSLVGQGRVELTPQYVIAFSRLLNYSPGDMGALTGVALPENVPPASSDVVEVARMAWDARRLDSDQLSTVMERLHVLRHNEQRPG
ncbi:hypothetical protein [Longispora urticae]